MGMGGGCMRSCGGMGNEQGYASVDVCGMTWVKDGNTGLEVCMYCVYVFQIANFICVDDGCTFICVHSSCKALIKDAISAPPEILESPWFSKTSLDPSKR